MTGTEALFLLSEIARGLRPADNGRGAEGEGETGAVGRGGDRISGPAPTVKERLLALEMLERQGLFPEGFAGVGGRGVVIIRDNVAAGCSP